MRTEAVSVIIPTYNRARLLPVAIRSALAALDADDEILVVDDGSTDDTSRVLDHWRDRVRYLRIKNRGPGAARNYGLAQAKNPLVAFLDSDDEWFADKLRLQRRLLAARPDVLFCFSDFRLRTSAGREVPHYLRHWHGIHRPWQEIVGPGVNYSSLAPLPPGREDFLVHVGDIYASLLEGPAVPAWTALVRREAAGAALRFAEDIRICEDWEYFARLARAGPAAFMACETAINNSHGGARLTTAHDQLQLLSARLVMTERVWGSDLSFLAGNGERYLRHISDIRLARAKWLLSRGRTFEARRELRRVSGHHVSTRVLATLPASFARALGMSRRAAIGAAHAAIHLLPYLESMLWPEI